jgi:hypothetical protein
VRSSDTFDNFATNVAEASQVSLRPTGKYVVPLEEDACYPIIALKTKYIASSEQFAGLMPYIGEALTKAVMAGVIEADWLEDIWTLFDLKTPAIPERFKEAGVPIKMYLNGDLGFVVQKEPVMEMPE